MDNEKQVGEDRSKWTVKQWYEHVGAWQNEKDEICFGTVMALGAMLNLMAKARAAPVQPVAGELPLDEQAAFFQHYGIKNTIGFDDADCYGNEWDGWQARAAIARRAAQPVQQPAAVVGQEPVAWRYQGSSAADPMPRWVYCDDAGTLGLRQPLYTAPIPAAGVQPFQQRVQPWMMACFGAEISADKAERNHRFFEEATELVQSTGMTASEAHQLVDYVFGRDIGEPPQEVGGVMVTLAALCLANDLDMHEAGEVELARIWTKVEAIRAKQAAKPKHSPLPQAAAGVLGDMVIGFPDPEAVFSNFCDREGFPSDGDMDAALRKAFYEGTKLGHPAPSILPDSGCDAALVDALRNIRDYRTDMGDSIAARSMRFYAEEALAASAVPSSAVALAGQELSDECIDQILKDHDLDKSILNQLPSSDAGLKAAWNKYCNGVELPLDDAFLFAAGFIAAHPANGAQAGDEPPSTIESLVGTWPGSVLAAAKKGGA